MKIEKHMVTLEVECETNESNSNFPKNAMAINVIQMMITDALCQCIRLSAAAERDGNVILHKHLEGKIALYTAIEKTMK